MQINFELLTDVDMVLFIKRGIRRAESMFKQVCAGQQEHAVVRSIEIIDARARAYLIYYNNNLYYWAMCQPLPYAVFRWVDDVDNFNVMNVALDSPTDYVLEVDLEYPQHLHDAHSDLPFYPTCEKPPDKWEEKLLATLYDKKRYVIHYRNLQQCTRHGLRITEIHHILQFAQSPWLREYIELNTNFRTLAKNEFDKNLFKLMNKRFSARPWRMFVTMLMCD